MDISYRSSLWCVCGLDSVARCVCFVVFFLCVLFFLFQAEDGIRDLVRSRGLGDVYKRQVLARGRGRARRFAGGGDLFHLAVPTDQEGDVEWCGEHLHRGIDADMQELVRVRAVSYTHLTLPTSDLG